MIRARDSHPRAALRGAALALVLAATFSSCASVSFTRDTESSGRFVSKAWSGTLLGWDIPRAALDIARENASDAGRVNTIVREAKVTPHLGLFNWILELISLRRARIEGTWGYAPE